MKEIDVAIGRNILRVRKLRGLTQTQLGEIFGITHQQIHKYENGSNGISAAKLMFLAKKLGVDITEFYLEAAVDVPIPKLTILAMNAFNEIKSESTRRQLCLLMRTLH